MYSQFLVIQKKLIWYYPCNITVFFMDNNVHGAYDWLQSVIRKPKLSATSCFYETIPISAIRTGLHSACRRQSALNVVCYVDYQELKIVSKTFLRKQDKLSVSTGILLPVCFATLPSPFPSAPQTKLLSRFSVDAWLWSLGRLKWPVRIGGCNWIVRLHCFLKLTPLSRLWVCVRACVWIRFQTLTMS